MKDGSPSDRDSSEIFNVYSFYLFTLLPSSPSSSSGVFGFVGLICNKKYIYTHTQREHTRFMYNYYFVVFCFFLGVLFSS